VHSLTFFKFSSKYLSLRIASTRGMLKPNCEAMCRAVLFTGSATCMVKMEERRVSESGVGGLKDLFKGNGYRRCHVFRCLKQKDTNHDTHNIASKPIPWPRWGLELSALGREPLLEVNHAVVTFAPAPTASLVLFAF
jgi:hypothetical protein